MRADVLESVHADLTVVERKDVLEITLRHGRG